MIERRQATPEVEKRYKALFRAIRNIESARVSTQSAIAQCKAADAQLEAAQLEAYDAILAGIRESLGNVRGELRQQYIVPYGE